MEVGHDGLEVVLRQQPPLLGVLLSLFLLMLGGAGFAAGGVALSVAAVVVGLLVLWAMIAFSSSRLMRQTLRLRGATIRIETEVLGRRTKLEELDLAAFARRPARVEGKKVVLVGRDRQWHFNTGSNRHNRELCDAINHAALHADDTVLPTFEPDALKAMRAPEAER